MTTRVGSSIRHETAFPPGNHVDPWGPAVTSLAFGASTILFWILTGIPGIIFGVWALQVTPRDRTAVRVVAMTGLVISLLGIALVGLALIPSVR